MRFNPSIVRRLAVSPGAIHVNNISIRAISSLTLHNFQPKCAKKLNSVSLPSLYRQTYPFSSKSTPSTNASVAEQIPSILDAPEGTPRVCVVGSGPSALYTAKYILQSIPDCRVHILERLPVPFGLVRHGIAPDHPEAKAVTNDFTKNVLDDPRVTLVCNIDVGVDVPLSDLQNAYNAVILAIGASGSRLLGIPGEDGPGVLDARHVVAWYNGHPDYAAAPPLHEARRVIIIGNGNVSLDVARVILASPSLLVNTDIPLPVRAELDAHPISSVHICARKPVTGAAWTIAELRELLGMLTRDDGVVLDPLQLDASTGSWRAGTPRKIQYHLHLHGAAVDAEDPAMAARATKRKTELLMGITGANVHWHAGHGTEGERAVELAAVAGAEPGVHHRHMHLHFGTTPTAIAHGAGPLADALMVRAHPAAVAATATTNVGKVSTVSTDATDDAASDDAEAAESDSGSDGASSGTGDVCVPIPSPGVDTGRVLVVKSIGYRTEPVEGAPIDAQRHVIPTRDGRVPDCPGVYAVGWASRGPVGIVGTHIGEAKAVSGVVTRDITAATAEDTHNRTQTPSSSMRSLWSGVRKAVVPREGWARIDAAERALGERVGVQGREGWAGSVKISDWEAQIRASRE